MNQERFSQLLRGPLSDPIPANAMGKLVIALATVVANAGDAGEEAKLDANLRWYMLHTEAFSLLCISYAARTGRTLEVIKEKFSTPAEHRAADRARVSIQRDALEKILSVISDSRDQHLSQEQCVSTLEKIRQTAGGAR